MKQHRSRNRLVSILALAAVGVLGIGGLVPAEDPPPPPPMERFNDKFGNVRVLLQNATAKLRRGVAGGLSADGSTADLPPTPGRLCCGWNIQRMNERFYEMQGALKELRACFAKQHDTGALDQLKTVEQDLQQLTRAVDLFAKSEEPGRTHAALAAAKRSYLLLEQSSGNVPPCSSEE